MRVDMQITYTLGCLRLSICSRCERAASLSKQPADEITRVPSSAARALCPAHERRAQGGARRAPLSRVNFIINRDFNSEPRAEREVSRAVHVSGVAFECKYF